MAGSLHYFKLMQREHLSDQDVQGLSWAAQGVLLNLRCHHWERGFLNADEAKILNLIGGNPKEARKVWEEIKPLFAAKDGGLVYPPDAAQREDTMGKVSRNQNREGRAKGGRPRDGADGSETEPGRNHMVPSDGTRTEHIPETEIDNQEVNTPLEEGERKFRAFFAWFKREYPRRGPNGIYKWHDVERRLRALIAEGNTTGEIGRGLAAYKPVAEASKDANTDFIPTPSRWLEQGMWMDEYPVVLKTVEGGKKTPGQMKAETMARVLAADGGR